MNSQFQVLFCPECGKTQTYNSEQGVPVSTDCWHYDNNGRMTRVTRMIRLWPKDGLDKKKIYLAHAYSMGGADEETKLRRFEEVNQMASILIEAGYVVFSPISHSHSIEATSGKIQTHRVWLGQDIEYIKWAGEIWIVFHINWRKSTGLRYESFCAHLLGKRVKFIPSLKKIGDERAWLKLVELL